MQQPPDQAKPAIPPSKDEGKTPAKDAAPVKQEGTKQEPSKQEASKDEKPQATKPLETAPELQQPVIPLPPPPGAKIAVQPQKPPGKFEIGSILVPALWLIGILTVGALLIAWLKKNRDRSFSALSISPHQQLSSFRDSMDEGEMTEEEFKKVKSHLAKKIKPPTITEPVPAPPPEKPVTPSQNGTHPS
jgi:hypothetical protein